MRPSKFTEDQIVQALREVRAGTSAVTANLILDQQESTDLRLVKKR